jgi:hypothetical protein
MKEVALKEHKPPTTIHDNQLATCKFDEANTRGTVRTFPEFVHIE